MKDPGGIGPGLVGLGRTTRVLRAEKGSGPGRSCAGDVWAPVRSVSVPEDEGGGWRTGVGALGYWK